ncbi:MAG: hypothetical protein AVDCRST_MAG57-90, partial [uncultured Blastococcus sp.]
ETADGHQPGPGRHARRLLLHGGGRAGPAQRRRVRPRSRGPGRRLRLRSRLRRSGIPQGDDDGSRPRPRDLPRRAAHGRRGVRDHARARARGHRRRGVRRTGRRDARAARRHRAVRAGRRGHRPEARSPGVPPLPGADGGRL